MSAQKLTMKETMFCKEFVKDFNASAAARRAGYSERTAAVIAHENLTKPYIKKRIAEILEKQEMEEGEIKKRISDIAKTDMGKYMVKKKIPYTPKIKVGLRLVIDEQKEYIRREEIFCERMQYTEKAFDAFQEGLNHIRQQIVRMEIELENNPGAWRIVDGETEMVEIAEFDMVKLVDDKDRGVIKSIKHTKEGVQAEGYGADAALNTLAKFKGLLVDKSEIDLNAKVDTTVKVGYGSREEGA